MRLCRLSRRHRIAGKKRLQNGGMLGHHGIDPRDIGEGRRPEQQQRIVQPARGIEKKPVARGKIEPAMERLVDRRRLRRVGAFLGNLPVERRQRIEFRRRPMPRR